MNSLVAQGRRVTLAVAAAAVLTLAACGDDDESATSTTLPTSVASTTAATTPAPTTTATPPSAAPATATTEAAPVTTTTVAATTTPAPATSTTIAPTTVAPTAVSTDTPISIFGIGPIRAGMTLREALATGVPVAPAGFDDFEGFCYGGNIAGQADLAMLVLAPGDEPPADPLDGVIGRVTLYTGVRPNAEGIHVGTPEQDVRDTYGVGSLTETDHVYVPGGHYLRYEDDGFAYVFETDGSVVTAMHAGDPNVVGYVEGCA